MAILADISLQVHCVCAFIIFIQQKTKIKQIAQWYETGLVG